MREILEFNAEWLVQAPQQFDFGFSEALRCGRNPADQRALLVNRPGTAILVTDQLKKVVSTALFRDFDKQREAVGFGSSANTVTALESATFIYRENRALQKGFLLLDTARVSIVFELVVRLPGVGPGHVKWVQNRTTEMKTA